MNTMDIEHDLTNRNGFTKDYVVDKIRSAPSDEVANIEKIMDYIALPLAFHYGALGTPENIILWLKPRFKLLAQRLALFFSLVVQTILLGAADYGPNTDTVPQKVMDMAMDPVSAMRLFSRALIVRDGDRHIENGDIVISKSLPIKKVVTMKKIEGSRGAWGKVVKELKMHMCAGLLIEVAVNLTSTAEYDASNAFAFMPSPQLYRGARMTTVPQNTVI